MNRTDQLLIRLEIEALNAEFAYLIDHNRSEEVAALFTDDGVYGRSTGERSEGRSAIAESYRRRSAKGPRTARHIFSNLHLTYDSEHRIRGTVILTLYAENGLPPLPAEPMVIADYDDIYVLCEDGRWRYQERIITWLFVREGAASPLALGAKAP
jgi:hypothetical protein